MGVGQRYAVIQLKTKYNAAFLKVSLINGNNALMICTLYIIQECLLIHTLQLSYESNHIEALSIIEEREKLEKFKHKSNHDLKKFNIILSNYSDSEQRQIKRYQRDDILADESLILRICEDISNIDSKDKNNRNTAIQEEI